MQLQMKGVVIPWMILPLVLDMSDLCVAGSTLPFCDDSTPPCIRRQPLRLPVCGGVNATATVEIQLPLNTIQQIAVGMDIIVYRGEQLLIQGLDCNPNFPDLMRWSVSHMLSKKEGKSGVLTVKIDVDDVQSEDEFETHIEIQLRDRILRTPKETWFTVDDNCSLSTIQTNEGMSFVQSDDFMHLIDQKIEELQENCIRNDLFNTIILSLRNTSSVYSSDDTTVIRNVHAIMWITSFMLIGLIILAVFGVIHYFQLKSHFKGINKFAIVNTYILARLFSNFNQQGFFPTTVDTMV